MANQRSNRIIISFVLGGALLIGFWLVNKPKQSTSNLISTRQGVMERRLQAISQYKQTGESTYSFETNNLPVQGGQP